VTRTSDIVPTITDDQIVELCRTGCHAGLGLSTTPPTAASAIARDGSVVTHATIRSSADVGNPGDR
jgi:hypothetical protein